MPRRSRQNIRQAEVAATVAEIVSRTVSTEVLPPAPNTPSIPSPLDVLDTVVEACINGTDLTPHRESITRLVLGQEQRAELIDNLLLSHEYTRLARFVRAQKVLEDKIFQALEGDSLSPLERLGTLEYLNSEITKGVGRVKAGAATVNDIVNAIAKMDATSMLSDEALAKKLSHTSPQGREIIRRIATRIGRVSRTNVVDV